MKENEKATHNRNGKKHFRKVAKKISIDGAFCGHIILMIDPDSTRCDESNDISHAYILSTNYVKKINFLKI
jgi:hypothetical protein